MAARYHSNIAEICEGDLADFEQVREQCRHVTVHVVD